MRKLILFVLISIFLMAGISFAGPEVFRDGAKTLVDPADGDGIGNRDYNDARYKDIENVVTVAKAGRDFTTIQAAIDSITDANATKRYVVRIFPGIYSENIVGKDHIALYGQGNRRAIELTSATGPVYTFPDYGGCVKNLVLSLSPTTDNQKLFVVPATRAERCSIRNSRFEVSSSTNGVTAMLADIGGTAVLDFYDCCFRYEATGSAVGVKTHTLIKLSDTAGANFYTSNLHSTVNDVDDNVILLDSETATTEGVYFANVAIVLNCTNVAYSGTAKALDLEGVGKRLNIWGSFIDISGLAGTGMVYFVDSVAGGAELHSSMNVIRIEGFTTNYSGNIATGDTLISHFDNIVAADSKTGAGNYYYVNAPSNGNLWMNGDCHATYIEFDDVSNSYIGKDKTYPNYFSFSNDYTNFWLGYSGDPNIWMNYEKNADIFLGAGTGGDTDVYIQEGDTNKTALNQEGIVFKVQSKVTNGGITLEPDGTGLVKTVGKHEVTEDPTTGDGLGNRDYSDGRYLPQDMNAIPAPDHTANGPKTNDINAGESVTIIDCVFLHLDGEWHKTDADAVATAEGMLAVSLETKTDGQAMNVAMPGSFIRDDSWAWTVGQEIYMALESGNMTQVAPSGTDDVVRILGHATHADRMFFRPEQTVVVHN